MATSEESSSTLFCVAGVGKIPWKGATKQGGAVVDDAHKAGLWVGG